jgi:hypothetical protein
MIINVRRRRPDWDREGRERRAREHGREPVRIDNESVEELDAALAVQRERDKAEFHRLNEPARRIAAEYRKLPHKAGHRADYIARLRVAIQEAVASASTPWVRRQLELYEQGLERRFLKAPRDGRRSRKRSADEPKRSRAKSGPGDRPAGRRASGNKSRGKSTFSIVWLDRKTKTRRRTTRSDDTSARELARQLIADGHGDVRYKRPGEKQWKAVSARGRGVRRKRPETPFPPKSPKSSQAAEKKGTDALDKRLPGSFEYGKRR